MSDTLYAGFPHLYLAGSPQVARRFVRAAASYAKGRVPCS
jgi:cobyrinic acid a,c-diamide synthase